MMPGLKGDGVKMEVFDGERSLACVPAVGQQDSAHIKEDHVEGEGWGKHRRLSVCIAAMNI
jgi:hypothetical protein